MNPFEVWIRPVDDFCWIRVERSDHARWLVLRLSEQFVFRTFEPLQERMGDSHCLFRVPFHLPLSLGALRRMLQSIPEVRLMRELA